MVLKINIKETIIGVQYLFVAFGATVLVPLLVGLDPFIALFAAGIGTVTGKDYIKEPGLHRTMLGDGIACMISGLAGGPPVTTYSEVTGAITLTRVANPYVLRVAAVTAILFSFIGKVNAVLGTIPQAVMGGIMLLLFGSIASIGIGNMITNKIDFSNSRNLIIVSLILTVGIGGATLTLGHFSMTGIGLAALLGVLLNLVLPKKTVST